DPTATTGQTISLNESRESEINSVLEILRSRALFEITVDRIGPARVLGGDALEEGVTAAEVAKYRERAIERLAKSSQIYAVRRSSIISVSCKARSPELAQEIVRTLMDAYLERHLDANRTAGSLPFFTEQAELLRTQLVEAEAELLRRKNGMKLTSVEGERANLLAAIASVDADILTTERERAGSAARRQELQDSL